MVTLEEKIFGNSLGAFILYAKMADGTIVPLAAAVNGDGTYSLRCDTELTAAIDPTGLAISAKQPALEGTDKAKVSLYVKKTANGDTVLTLGKTDDANSLPVALSTEALAALETISIGGPLGDQAKAASVSIAPATDIPTGRYIGANGLVGFKVLQTFTRPSDGNAYIAGDCICNSTSAPAIMTQDLASFGGAANRFLVITNARVISSVKGSGLSCNICIFPATFTGTNDNAELSIDDTTAASGGIVIPCNNNYTLAVNARAVSDPGWWEMQLASSSIYFVLQAASGYTPASGEVFTVVMEGFLL